MLFARQKSNQSAVPLHVDFPKPQHEEELERERMESAIPFVRSPFLDEKSRSLSQDSIGSAKENQKEVRTPDPDELVVDIKEEVGWIDLLLELAMATAFANLADNTPINTPNELASYVAFFTLVWWIWASQVAYNMRFRQGDWFHRSCAFLLLVVFSAMAAFTNNFDMTNGLTGEDEDSQIAANISMSLGLTNAADLHAQQVREGRLPVLNFKGVAIVMMCSRLLMLAQYSLVFYHARRFRRHAILTHMIGLAISTIFYLVSFLVLLPAEPSKGANIVKIFFWFAAIVLEIVSLFIANAVPGRVVYPGEAVFGRSSTLFIVVLGIGLDKITNQFKFVVGTIGFGAISVVVALSVAVVLIGYFSLYFGAGEVISGGSTRSLVYFLMHLPFMAAVIVMLRGVASMLSYVNFAGAVNTSFDAFSTIFDAINPDTVAPLTVADVPSLVPVFDKIGLSLESILDAVNDAINTTLLNPPDTSANSTVLLAAGENPPVLQFWVLVLQIMTTILVTILKQFEALPEETSPLFLKIFQFQEGDAASTDPNDWGKIVNEIIIERLNPSLWFLGTSGFVFIMLGVLLLLKRTPRDKWEWASFSLRIIPGVILCLFSLFDIGFQSPFLSFEFDQDGNVNTPESNAIIWKFADSGWILPALALALIVVNFLNLLLAFFARRSLQAAKKNQNGANSHAAHAPNDMTPFVDLSSSATPTGQPNLEAHSYPPAGFDNDDRTPQVHRPLPPGAMPVPTTATPFSSGVNYR